MLTPLAIALAVLGGLWGFAADRIAARWPEHEDESVRAIDWRTPVVVVIGALAMGVLTLRFPDPVPALIFGAYTVVLVLLLATDLDQRLLPNEFTLPAIPIVLVIDIAGLNPLVTPAQLPIAIAVALIIPGILLLVSIPFGAGAIGLGDIKLLVSVGLLAGPFRLFTGGALRGDPRGRRDHRAARDAPDHAQDVHPVRAVPDHRGALGDLRDPIGQVRGGLARSRGRSPGPRPPRPSAAPAPGLPWNATRSLQRLSPVAGTRGVPKRRVASSKPAELNARRSNRCREPLE